MLKQTLHNEPVGIMYTGSDETELCCLLDLPCPAPGLLGPTSSRTKPPQRLPHVRCQTGPPAGAETEPNVSTEPCTNIQSQPTLSTPQRTFKTPQCSSVRYAVRFHGKAWSHVNSWALYCKEAMLHAHTERDA